MSITASELLAVVAVRGADEAALKLVAVGGASDSAAAKLGMLATGAAVLAGAALVGIGVASVKMAGDFQQGVTRLVTGAGDVTDNMQKMGQSILGVSVATGTMTGPLNQAMYLIISAHQRAAQAINTLTVASKGAVIEQASVVDVANVLSGVMTNYGTKTYNATQFMNGLITAVQQGKVTLQDLAVAMGPIDPIAQSLGIHFQDAAAAMTTQTNAMIPAARAATGLRFMMLGLENPTKKAKDAMTALGLDSVKVAEEMKVSLPAALQMIYDAAKKAGPEGSVPFNRAVGDMIGGIRGLSAFSALTGTHMKDFAKNTALIADAMQHNKDAVIGWDTAQTNFNVQLDRGKAALAALGISIGQQLLPYVTQLVQQIIPLVVQFTDWVVQNHVVEKSLAAVGTAISTTVSVISNMIATGTSVVQFFQHNQLAADALGVAIGMLGGVMALFVASSMADMILSLLEYGLSILTAVAETVTGAAVMTSTFTTMSGMIITSMGAAAASILATLGPFLLAGAVIAAVAIGIVLAIQHWGEISAWLQTTWSNTLSWFNGALQTVGTSVQAVINWFNAWRTPIEVVGGLILTFFAPALIIAGTQAAIAGAKITTSFIVSIVQSGLAATISGYQISSSFIVSIIATGTQAVITAGKVTISFIASLYQSGLAAVISAGQITYAFVASLIRTGVEGWIAAGKLAVYIGSLIATGVQAGIASLPITGQFVVALIKAGVEAVIAGAKLVFSFVAGLIATASEARLSATILTTTIIPALTATGVAATAAAGVIGIAGAIIIATFLLIQNKAYDMDKTVTTSTGEMVQANQLRWHQMATGATTSGQQMNAGMSNAASTMNKNVSGSANQMYQNVIAHLTDMKNQGLEQTSQLTWQASDMFAAMGNRVGIDMANMDATAKGYWNDVADYINNHPLNATLHNQGTSHHFAEGTDYAPGGLSVVGERGPELMYIPRGAQIIPHNQISNTRSGTSSGGNQPIQVNLNVDGQTFASLLVDHMGNAIMRKSNLQYGRRVF